jgi:hypothetical protein
MKKFNLDVVIGILGLLFIAFIIIGSPFALVWAWNVLFSKLHFIEYTFENWVAVSIFMWALGLLKLDMSKK